MTPPSVSRETSPRLAALADLIQEWSPRINLIAKGDLDAVWTRHIDDSVQLYALAPANARTWIDLGSGGGFPGLVVAALAAEADRPLQVTLIDSDLRKAAFLREAARQLDLPVEIQTRRIEAVPPTPADIVSARALAALPRLLALACPFCHPGTTLVFPKGRQAETELTHASRDWHIRVERLPSRTDPDATVLKITDLARRP